MGLVDQGTDQGAGRRTVLLITPDRMLGEALAVACVPHALQMSVVDPRSDDIRIDGKLVVLDLLADDAAITALAVALDAGSPSRIVGLAEGPVIAASDIQIDGWITTDSSIGAFAAKLADANDASRNASPNFAKGRAGGTDAGQRVVLAEPRRLVREALAGGLDGQPDLAVCAQTDDTTSTLLQLQRTGAEVLVLSAGMRADLPALCADLRGLSPRPRTLFLDQVADDDRLLLAVEAGIDGYTTGAAGLSAVADAVRATARGESVVPPSMLGPLLRRLIERRRDAAEAAERLRELTRREREVFGLLVEGHDDAGIAATLVISPETARTHVHRILRKLDVHSRGDAVALAASNGMADQLERALERSAS